MNPKYTCPLLAFVMVLFLCIAVHYSNQDLLKKEDQIRWLELICNQTPGCNGNPAIFTAGSPSGVIASGNSRSAYHISLQCALHVGQIAQVVEKSSLPAVTKCGDETIEISLDSTSKLEAK